MSGDATEGEEEDVMAAQRKNEWALNVFFSFKETREMWKQNIRFLKKEGGGKEM